METNLYPLPNSTGPDQSIPLSLRLKDRLARLSVINSWQGGVYAAIGLFFIYVIINAHLSSQWVNQPFAGFLHQNRTVIKQGLPDWEINQPRIQEISLKEGDIILAVNGQTVSSSEWLTNYLRQLPVGQMVTYFFLNREGKIRPDRLAVAQFRSQDFFQLVALPAFVAFVLLMTAGATAHLRADLLAVKLITLFTLALVFYLASFPSFILNQFFVLNFIIGWTGKIVMPSLLLHFLLVVPRSRNGLRKWPFLLPLIYLPVLPGLIHIPILLIDPTSTRNFDIFINLVTVVYAVVGFASLLDIIVLAKEDKLRRQALVLLLGLILPACLLLFSLLWSYSSVTYETIYKNLEQYGFIGMPIAVVIAVIRYEMFGIERTNLTRLVYMGAVVLALFAYFILIAFVQPVATNLFQFQPEDGTIILTTTAVFFLIQPLYRRTSDWFRQRAYGNIEDFRVGLRLFSRNLLNIKSRRDLESLVSWEVVSDFRLRSAELTPSSRPTTPYALALPLKVSNIPLGTFFVGTKITGKGFTAQELDVLKEMQKQISLALWSIELDEAIQSTEQLTRLKSKFLTNVTHELRTPLNGIINYIGFVIDDYRDSLNREQLNYLEQALQGAEKLLEIINNILDMSKIEAGQMRLYLQPVNLTGIITKLEPLIEDMIKDKPVRLIVDLSPELPALHGDQLRLRQIILNLLSNAAKFTQAGTIYLHCYQNKGSIVIEVTDTGIGIDEKVLPSIFQQFASTNLTDARKDFGPGLSMPITKALVELHGGHIALKSQPSQGTTFTVTLPIRHTNGGVINYG
jgi:signal transduction histidine kinase